MNFKEKLNQVRALLSMEVKLETAQLMDGATVEAEQFAPEYPINIVTENGNVPLPIGTYETTDGKILTIEQEGVIATYGDKPAEEEVAEVEAQSEPEPAPAPQPKQIKEIKEINFASEDVMGILKTIIETDAPELSPEKVSEIAEDLSEVIAEILVAQPEAFGKAPKQEMSAEPIVHNPENEKKIEFTKIGKSNSIKETIYKQLFN